MDHALELDRQLAQRRRRADGQRLIEMSAEASWPSFQSAGLPFRGKQARAKVSHSEIVPSPPPMVDGLNLRACRISALIFLGGVRLRAVKAFQTGVSPGWISSIALHVSYPALFYQHLATDSRSKQSSTMCGSS
jgi:hypothetical protein